MTAAPGDSAAPASATSWHHEDIRTLTLADQSRERYVPIPFEVPRGTESFEVALELIDDDPASPAAIDLGCEGPTGWRGWSGGARDAFVIGKENATPGYLPGPLEAGTWAVILGIHALPLGSARVRVTVRAPAVDKLNGGRHPLAARSDSLPGNRTTTSLASQRGLNLSPSRPVRNLPAPPGFFWVVGDTHAHSEHSDGTLSLNELAASAADSGLDYLCVTDHNTVSHHAQLPAVSAEHGVLVVPGQEITTHRGHANAFGDIGFIDFRRPVADWASTVAQRGGVISINHPIAGDCSWLDEIPPGIGGIEVLHGDLFDQPVSTASLGWVQQVIAARGGPVSAGISLLAGGDFHRPLDKIRPGTPATWLCVQELSVDGVIGAIKAGRTALTASADRDGDGPLRPRLHDCPIAVRLDDATLHLDRAAGHVLVDSRGQRRWIGESTAQVEANIEYGPFRLENALRQTVAMVA